MIHSCLRRKGNWSELPNNFKFDNANFNAAALKEAIPIRSTKMAALFDNIKRLDEADLQTEGKLYKHFIYSDVDESGYGAKLIVSCFLAMGYSSILAKTKGKVQIQKPVPNNTFAMLLSGTVWGDLYPSKLKKRVREIYNSRDNTDDDNRGIKQEYQATNEQGKIIRFIILDSKFKEGIDLFDVKYAHVFEPLTTKSEFTQVVGRGTRTCGQKGLHFVQDVGWLLHVITYVSTMPDVGRGLIFPDGNHVFAKTNSLHEAIIQYSTMDPTKIKLINELENMAPAVAVDYDLTKAIHVQQSTNVIKYTGGASFEAEYRNLADQFVQIKDGSKAAEGSTRYESALGSPEESTRYESALGPPETSTRYESALGSPEGSATRSAKPQYHSNSLTVRRNLANQILAEETSLSKTQKKLLAKRIYSGVELSNSPVKSPLELGKPQPLSTFSYVEMGAYILKYYKAEEFNWARVKAVNKCITTTSDNPLDAIVKLNPTQHFITRYFTPECPYKGMLLWHSVGTGKTCTGIATATSTFEPAGYMIIWVTRSSLKKDVAKNMYKKICDNILIDKIRAQKVKLPLTSTNKRAGWLEPAISYKTFSNMLSKGKGNKLYDKLFSRNPKDVLWKTLVIVDEAQKLYSGELEPVEQPNMAIFERMLQNSYKVSGADSSRLLLMTATPITKDPFELFKLINLCKEEAHALPTTVDVFKQRFMKHDEIDREKMANALTGHISYLNLAKDVSQFAQAVHTTVEVPISIDEAQIYALPKFEEIRVLNALQTELDNLLAEQKSIIENYVRACSTTQSGGYKQAMEKLKALYDAMHFRLTPPPPVITEVRGAQSRILGEVKPVEPLFRGTKEECEHKAQELYQAYDVKIEELRGRIAKQNQQIQDSAPTKKTKKNAPKINLNYQVSSLQKCFETIGKKKTVKKKLA